MKVIFLDIDGVLNNQIDDDCNKGWQGIGTRCASLLQELVRDTGAKIVISSSWRKIHSLEEIDIQLQEAGFHGDIIDKTGKCCSGIRGVEIRNWLQGRKDVESYVILDDDSDMLLWQAPYFIRLDNYVGLTPNAVYRAKNILNGVRHD